MVGLGIEDGLFVFQKFLDEDDETLPTSQEVIKFTFALDSFNFNLHHSQEEESSLAVCLNFITLSNIILR